LLRAQLLQIFYSIRSERLLMEQLAYNLLFRWFVGLTMDEPVWDPTAFTKNRDRLLNQEVARSFFRRVVERAQGLMSDEHFTVDGTLIEAWASQKSFQRKDGKPDGDGKNFHGQTRRNGTHASKTDPDAKLYRKSNGAESRLSYLGHLLLENRHGLIVDAMASGARCRAVDGARAVEARAVATTDHWGGQGVRRPRLHRRHARAGLHAACDAESEPTGRKRDRCPHDAACGLWHESARPATHRTRVRLVENHRLAPQGQTPRLEKVDWLVVFASAAFNLIRLPKLLPRPA
jgi:transposase-like protein DUF772